MSPLPTRMADHWYQRPGRPPGREMYQWHVLFHDQPRVRELAALARERLAGLEGLDPVPGDWLHLTTFNVGFVDEVPERAVEAMVAEARRLGTSAPAIPVRLGRVLYGTEAVTLAVEPLGALDPVLDLVRAATRSGGIEGHGDIDPWIPHVSVAYSHDTGPAAPIIAALGRHLPPAEVAIGSVSLVAQTQVGRSWRWRPIAEVALAGVGPAGGGPRP